MIAAMPAMNAYGSDDIKIIVDGEEVSFEGDQSPVIENGRTLVPFRAVFEKMGAEVKWFSDIKLCEASLGQLTVGIHIDSTEVVLGDGMSVESDVPAKIMNGRTMVPLRVLSEGIGAEVEWDGETKTVTINTPETDEAPSSVEYEMLQGGGDNMDTGFYIDFEYPSVTSDYTMAKTLNENIYNDIFEAVDKTLDSYDGDKKSMNIKCSITENDSGILSLKYLADDETFYEASYGIMNGAKIDDNFLNAMDKLSEDIKAAEDAEKADEAYTIEEYTAEKKADDGSNYIYAAAQYPVFSGESEEIAKLNEELEKAAKQAADDFVEDYAEDAKKIYDNPPQKLFEVPYNFYKSCEVTLDGSVASISETTRETLYGSDDAETKSEYTADLDTGEISKLLGTTKIDNP